MWTLRRLDSRPRRARSGPTPAFPCRGSSTLPRRWGGFPLRRSAIASCSPGLRGRSVSSGASETIPGRACCSSPRSPRRSSAARSRSRDSVRSSLFRLDARRLHQRGIGGDLLAEIGVELLGGVVHRLGAEARYLL